MAQSNGAFPYGGLDLCRFSDADQRVAASIGGNGAANFGVVVKHGDDVVVSSSVPRKKNGPPPLTMTKGPRGKITDGAKYPSTPYAGSFSDLEVTGVRKGGGVTVRSTNHFKPDRIVGEWQVDPRGQRPGARRRGPLPVLRRRREDHRRHEVGQPHRDEEGRRCRRA